MEHRCVRATWAPPCHGEGPSPATAPRLARTSVCPALLNQAWPSAMVRATSLALVASDLDGTPDGTCNEPWMFPEVLPLVREAIRLRYSLVPYLYLLLRRAVHEHEPLLRPTFLDHEADPRAWAPTDDFLLGDSLLVAHAPIRLEDCHRFRSQLTG